MASAFADMRCSASLMNSLCVRRTSRYWVVRNRGRFVWKGQSWAPASRDTDVDVKLQNGVLSAIPLQPGDLGLQLVLRAVAVRPPCGRLLDRRFWGLLRGGLGVRSVDRSGRGLGRLRVIGRVVLLEATRLVESVGRYGLGCGLERLPVGSWG
jgi:hypothetical protein